MRLLPIALLVNRIHGGYKRGGGQFLVRFGLLMLPEVVILTLMYPMVVFPATVTSQAVGQIRISIMVRLVITTRTSRLTTFIMTVQGGAALGFGGIAVSGMSRRMIMIVMGHLTVQTTVLGKHRVSMETWVPKLKCATRLYATLSMLLQGTNTKRFLIYLFRPQAFL
jgi:hypothetical protein